MWHLYNTSTYCWLSSLHLGFVGHGAIFSCCKWALVVSEKHIASTIIIFMLPWKWRQYVPSERGCLRTRLRLVINRIFAECVTLNLIKFLSCQLFSATLIRRYCHVWLPATLTQLYCHIIQCNINTAILSDLSHSNLDTSVILYLTVPGRTKWTKNGQNSCCLILLRSHLLFAWLR